MCDVKVLMVGFLLVMLVNCFVYSDLHIFLTKKKWKKSEVSFTTHHNCVLSGTVMK